LDCSPYGLGAPEATGPDGTYEVAAPPGPGYNWVPGHWAWRGRWVWIPGHHIRGVVPPIPAEVVEVVPARPGPEFYWVKGHYVWEGGRWAWHRGVWVR